MSQKISLFVMLILATALFSGCAQTKKYFDGKVVVSGQEGDNYSDARHYLSIEFMEKGTYEVSFSVTPDRYCRGNKVPKTIIKTVESVPQKIVIHRTFPEFLRVTIAEQGKESQSHDFVWRWAG